jgi:PAS domain S-box-containing protein
MFAWRGHGRDGPFINQFRFEELKPGWDGVHGERERLVVEDWSQVPDVWASNAGDVLRAEQVRASQSTPIIGRRNQTIGALNTHWSAPYRPSDEQLRLIDLLAWTAADFIERHRALAALQQTEERFRQFGEASSDVLWIRDADSLRWEYLSPAFEAVYGTPVADAMRGDTLRNWADIIVPEDREDALAAIRRVSAGEFVSFEYRVMRADGQLRWLRNSDFPIRDAAGDVVRIGGVGHDITAVKWAQQHQQTLLAELQHRVRNTLSVIKSIARRTAESSRSVDEYAAHLDGRIEAFSRVQAIVTRNPGDGVSFRTLVEDEMLAHAMREGPQLHIRGPDLRLNPRAAESMSLAVHELATNAVKHGALSAPHGRIAAHWSVTGGRFDFDWTETGVADAMEAPQGDGFGMELLLRSLPYDLDAITNASFEPQGLKFTLSAPAQLLLMQDVTAPA